MEPVGRGGWGGVIVFRMRNAERERERESPQDVGEREREDSNSKTLFYKDCSLGSVKKPV